MKKFLVFIVLILSISVSSQTQVINNTNFPVALYSGIPDINIPLFNVSTANSDFSFDLKVENSLYACTSEKFSTNGIGDGWSLNVLSTITTKPQSYQGLTIMYDESAYSTLLENSEDKDGHSVYTYSAFGLNGRFIISKTGIGFTTKIIEQNDYAEVLLDYSVNGTVFRINSFTIRDKHGFEYLFGVSDKKKTSMGAFTGQYFAEKVNFYLTRVKDKYNKILLSYGYDNSSPFPNQYENSAKLTSINVIDKGTITIPAGTSMKRTLTYNDVKGNRVQKIDFGFISGYFPFQKVLMNSVKIYSNDDTKFKEYKVSYKQYGDVTADKTLYGFPHVACSYLNFKEENLRYDHGAVEKITTPEGGVTFYEYEPNTIGLSDKPFAGLTPGTTRYNMHIQMLQSPQIYKNWTLESIPLIYNSQYGGYFVDLDTHLPLSTLSRKVLYIDYKSNMVEIFPPNPDAGIPGKYHLPKVKVLRYFDINTVSPNNPSNIVIEPTICNPGTDIPMTDDGIKFFISIENQYQSYYQYLNAYYIKGKDENQLIEYQYFIAPRIKRIKSFSQATSSVNALENVVSEQLYKYEMFNYTTTSSGHSRYANGSYVFNHINYAIYDFADAVVYKNVTVETPGIGKTEYEFNEASIGSAGTKDLFVKAKLLTSLKKYNLLGQLIESNNFERTYADPAVLINNEMLDANKIVQTEKITSNIFESGATIPYTVLSESTFDPITRHMVLRKIENNALSETFKENYAYQKLGNAYYQTQVEKFKNNTPLNRSVFEYQQYGSTQAYNLVRTKIAKSTLPLEVEKEITRYDDFGNVLEYKTKEGMVVSQIWGYGNSKLVAELKNVSYSDISVTVRNNIANYSNQGGSAYSETNLTTALNSLRNSFLSGFVTTYTYNPLVGITSITDANGRKETYQYDSFNRLYRVLNHEGLITKEYSYNIKN